MKKTYTKKQITEAIKYWTKQLRKINESTSETLIIDAIRKAATIFSNPDKQRMAFVLLSIAVSSSTSTEEKVQNVLKQLESDDSFSRLFKEVGTDLYEYLGM